jgi:iron complex transport system ATP-binding protein
MEPRYYFRTSDLTVGYEGKPLIRGINIGVEKGSILTLIGPNGAGKSTILKSITGHLAILAGVAYIGQDNLKDLKGKELAKRLSVVLTERIHPELMTCREVVASGRYPYTNHFGRLTDHDKDIVNASLERVGAMDIIDQDFSRISDGQRQRVMVARAICQEPDVMVLDEPTSFLDIRHKIELLKILRDLSRSKQTTIVISMHEIELAAKFSDSVVCVKGGVISGFGTPEEIFTEENIRKLYDLDQDAYNLWAGSFVRRAET